MKLSYSLILIAFSAIPFSTTYAQDNDYNKYERMGYTWNNEQFIILKKKIAFESGCDTSKIKLTILSTRFESNGGEPNYHGQKKQKQVDKITATSIGSDACGQKSIYVLTGTGVWVLNSVSGEKK